MPLLTGLDFAANALVVSYRAQEQPQDLEIDIETTGVAGEPTASILLNSVITSINAGAAGGVHFAPWLSSAEHLTGPWHADDAVGPAYRWTLRVAAVAPLFIRSIVERLRGVGFTENVRFMRILGSAALDSSELSVRENQVRSWLDDPSAYQGAWPHAEFPLTVRRSRGATLRVELATRITPELRDQLETLYLLWLNSVTSYVSDPGFLEEGNREVIFNPHKMFPATGVGKTEFRAASEEFLHTRGPARAVLCNMLGRFHRTVSPIVEAEIGL
jgi:hypothetical protein